MDTVFTEKQMAIRDRPNHSKHMFSVSYKMLYEVSYDRATWNKIYELCVLVTIH